MCANDIAFSLRGDFDSIQFDPSKVSKIDICRKPEGLFASYLTNYLSTSKIPRSAGKKPPLWGRSDPVYAQCGKERVNDVHALLNDFSSLRRM